MRKDFASPGLRGASTPPRGSKQPQAIRTRAGPGGGCVQPTACLFWERPKDKALERCESKKPLENRGHARPEGAAAERQQRRPGLPAALPGAPFPPAPGSCPRRGRRWGPLFPRRRTCTCRPGSEPEVSGEYQVQGARPPSPGCIWGAGWLWRPGERMSRGAGMSLAAGLPAAGLVQPQHRDERQLDGEVT